MTGRRTQLSERPLLCSASHPGLGEVVIGGSDHALYILEAASCKLKRTLFGKTAGHTEWVTCVIYTPEGHVISGVPESYSAMLAGALCMFCKLLYTFAGEACGNLMRHALKQHCQAQAV